MCNIQHDALKTASMWHNDVTRIFSSNQTCFSGILNIHKCKRYRYAISYRLDYHRRVDGIQNNIKSYVNVQGLPNQRDMITVHRHACMPHRQLLISISTSTSYKVPHSINLTQFILPDVPRSDFPN